MKKYIITSHHFSGKIEVGYDECNLLTYLNMNCFIGSSNMKVVVLYQIPYQLNRVPFENMKDFIVKEVTNA